MRSVRCTIFHKIKELGDIFVKQGICDVGIFGCLITWRAMPNGIKEIDICPHKHTNIANVVKEKK